LPTRECRDACCCGQPSCPFFEPESIEPAIRNGGFGLGISRLLFSDEANRFAAFGSGTDWYRRAAEAGDPWALSGLATDMALDPADPQGVERALAMAATLDLRNRAEAAFRIGNWILGRRDEPENVVRAFFFASLELHLAETMDGLPAFSDPGLANQALDLVRGRGRTLEPRLVVDAYRAARAWRAGPSPD